MVVDHGGDQPPSATRACVRAAANLERARVAGGRAGGRAGPPAHGHGRRVRGRLPCLLARALRLSGQAVGLGEPVILAARLAARHVGSSGAAAEPELVPAAARAPTTGVGTRGGTCSLPGGLGCHRRPGVRGACAQTITQCQRAVAAERTGVHRVSARTGEGMAVASARQQHAAMTGFCTLILPAHRYAAPGACHLAPVRRVRGHSAAGLPSITAGKQVRSKGDCAAAPQRRRCTPNQHAPTRTNVQQKSDDSHA